MSRERRRDRSRVGRATAAAAAAVVIATAAAGAGCGGDPSWAGRGGEPQGDPRRVLASLPTRPPGSMAGYTREAFPHWADSDNDGCDTRDEVLARDLTRVTVGEDCEITAGTLRGPYSGEMLRVRGGDADGIHVDHVVALAYAWRHGADDWTERRRRRFANDPANLLAVDAGANIAKSDQGPADWRPDQRSFRCEYAATFVAAAADYRLSIIPADRDALADMLDTCPRGEEWPGC